MKRTLLSIITIAVFGFGTNAQITINSTDIIFLGLIVENAEDSSPTGITIGSSGANQTWDFSSLNEDGVETISFVDPSTLPGNLNFASSNIGSTSSNAPEQSLFLTKNTSELILDGTYININPFFSIPINQTLLTFPSTMGTSYSTTEIDKELSNQPILADPDAGGPADYIFEVKRLSDINITSDIDGWGDVTTPMGIFASLRQIVTDVRFDTVYARTDVLPSWHPISAINAAALGMSQNGYDTIRTARWWTDNPLSQFALVEIDYEGNGDVNKVLWQKANLTAGISEISEDKLSVYPNPATNQITIESASKIEGVSVFNMFGALVQFEKSEEFSIESLPTGVYFVDVETMNGIFHSRFIKE